MVHPVKLHHPAHVSPGLLEFDILHKKIIITRVNYLTPAIDPMFSGIIRRQGMVEISPVAVQQLGEVKAAQLDIEIRFIEPAHVAQLHPQAAGQTGRGGGDDLHQPVGIGIGHDLRFESALLFHHRPDTGGGDVPLAGVAVHLAVKIERIEMLEQEHPFPPVAFHEIFQVHLAVETVGPPVVLHPLVHFPQRKDHFPVRLIQTAGRHVQLPLRVTLAQQILHQQRPLEIFQILRQVADPFMMHLP